MSQYYDTDGLIDSIKRRINIPASQITFDDDDLLAFANEELALSVVPAIMSLHEDYLLFSEDVVFDGDDSVYSIPYRAVGNKLYDLQFVDSNGNALEMSRTTEGDAPMYNGTNVGSPLFAYYVKNNKIITLPAESSASGYLRFIYFIRPAELVSMDRIGVITDINTTTGEVVVSSMPSHFTTNITFDLYKVKSPHSIIAIDLTAATVNSSTNTIELDPDDLPQDLAVGDHITMSTEAGIPQIPSDLHVLLAQKVAERVLEAQGDVEGLQIAKMKSAEMENRAGNIIDNRVDESPIKLVNRRGVLRTGLRRR